MSKNYSIKKAFTLVELLVVIAIVGILSGLIIVGMSSSVDNARLAKAQIFSSSLRDSLLASLVSEWKFDELSSALENQVVDDTWNSNNCTLYTGTDGLDKLKNGSNCVYGKCLSFDGSNDYLSCATATNLDLLSNFTVSAWVKTISTATQIFVERETSGSTAGYNILSASGKLEGRIYGGAGVIQSTTSGNVHTHMAVFQKAWKHRNICVHNCQKTPSKKGFAGYYP